MGERDRRDGLGELWDSWVDRVNAPSEDEEESEPLTLRDVLVTGAAFVAVGGGLVLLHRIVHFNWGWVPWKQLGAIGLVLAAGARWIFLGVRSLVRRIRGLPPPEREPSKRDRLAEKLRDLDEPYMRRERSLTRD
jgi:hypothetical protein